MTSMTLNSAPLRLLVIGDGSHVHTARWLRFFAERGHVVGLISAEEPGHGVQIAEYFPLSRQSMMPGARILKNVMETRRAIARFRPDIVHAHYINEWGWLGALSGFRPFTLTAWGSDIYLAPKESKLAAKLSPWSVRRADWVSADSQAQVRALQAMGATPDKSQMMAWGVENAFLKPADAVAFRAKYDLQDDHVVLLAPRQWIENSNIDVVVDAFATLHKQYPQTRLLLKRLNINPANYKDKIEAQIAGLNLGAVISIIEEMPESDLPAMYAASDIVISICTSDGTPMSVLEAMASRCAVVVSDLPDLAEWVEDGAQGFRVGARDTKALTAKLSLLVSDAALREHCAKTSRQLAEAKADRAANFQIVEDVYRRLVDRCLVDKG